MIHILFKLASTIYQTYLHGPWHGWHGRITEVPELLIGTMADDTAAGVPAPSFASLDFIFSVYCLWWRSDKSNQIYWINGNSLQWHPVGRKVRWGEDSLYSTNEAEGTQRESSKYRWACFAVWVINQSWKVPESSRLDSSLKRHTALIKRMRQSIGAENREHILKDIDSLSLEKYIDEIAGAAVEGVGRCKTEKDVWSAVEVCTLIPPGQLWLMSWPFWSKVISALHRRFPNAFTPALVSSFATALSAPSRGVMSALVPEQREKEDAARIMKQRPVLRICSELALVAIIRDSPKRSGGEWIMKCLKELVRVPVSSHLLVILNLEF